MALRSVSNISVHTELWHSLVFYIQATARPKERFSTKVILLASVAAAFVVLVSWTMLAQQIETATEMVVQASPATEAQQQQEEVGETRGLLE